jgi:colanic acid/amylovoran biosynthesis glycosyltransferase
VRIGLVVREFPALSETFILDQALGLLRHGHEVEIYAIRARRDAIMHPRAESLLSCTHYCPDLTDSIPTQAARMLRIFAGGAIRRPLTVLSVLRHRPLEAAHLVLRVHSLPQPRSFDIIHCHFGLQGLEGLALRDLGLLSGRLVTTFYGYDLSEVLERRGPALYRPLFSVGDLFLAVSARFRDRLVQLGAPPNRVFVQHLGVDCDRLSYRKPQPAPDIVTVLSVARLVEKKGIEFGIRAVARLAATGRDIRYLVAGDGPLRTPLERLAHELGVGATVRFLGATTHDQVGELLRDATVFLAPSVTSSSGDEEGIPVAVTEAMAVGVPVIASRHAGIPEVVIDGTTGLLTAERDVDGIAAALRRLIDERDLALQLAREARRLVEGDFNAVRQEHRLLELYRSILQ